MNVLSIDVDWAISGLHQQHLSKLFYNKLNKANRIVFANHHHIIVEVLTDINNINLFNIDHHHDVCYREYHKQDIIEKKVEASNWVGGLLYHKKLSNLTWIGNIESEPIGGETLSEEIILQSKVNYIVDFTLDNLYNNDYNLIFVCRSDYCIEEKYRSLYDTFRISCEELYPSKTEEIRLNQDLPRNYIKLK